MGDQLTRTRMSYLIPSLNAKLFKNVIHVSSTLYFYICVIFLLHFTKILFRLLHPLGHCALDTHINSLNFRYCRGFELPYLMLSSYETNFELKLQLIQVRCSKSTQHRLEKLGNILVK